MVELYKNTPGILFWMLGNENNYGLSWASSEIENLPQGERDAAKVRYLYSLFGEIAAAIKANDSQHLVTICNGDLQYLNLIAKEAPGIDLLGVNVYRGKTATDLFTRVKSVLGKPVFFSEFGADAFNARSGREEGWPRPKS
jgi:beta-galactosidase